MDLIQTLDINQWCFTEDIGKVQDIVSTIITAIQIAVPILLIIFGMLDFGKAVMANKEEEIKKGQQTFIKRLISAALVFLVIFVVKILIGILAPSEKNNGVSQQNLWNCVDNFINGSNSSGTNDTDGKE